MTDATTLEAKRAQLDQKLAALRMSPAAADLVRQADQAVAAHRAEADELERALAEVDAQLGVRENDKREAAARQKEAQWQAARQQLVAESETLLSTIDNAERAARAYVKAITDMRVSNARLSKLALAVSVNGKVPRPLNEMELISRMSSRLTSVLATIKWRPYAFGNITWSGAASGLYPAEQGWRQSEETVLAKQVIQPLLEKGKV